MTNQNSNQKQISAVDIPAWISRDGDKFTACYEQKETVEHNVALPVYTGGLTPKGTIAKSRTLKKLSTASKTVTRQVEKQLTEAEARAFCQAAKAHDQIASRSVLSEDRWVVYFK